MRKTILITGGAKGIGRAIAVNLARDHDVALTWRNTAPKGLPANVVSIQAELTDPDAPKEIVKQTLQAFGCLNGIVNNAGTIATSSAGEPNLAGTRDMLETNVLAPSAMLAAARAYLDSGDSVLNISSVNATLPPGGAAMFGASKAALELWTRGMAKELGPHGIRVNALAPGAINIPEDPRPGALQSAFADLTALGRMGAPEDIAKAARFLLSDEASFVTGQTLRVCGGYRL